MANRQDPRPQYSSDDNLDAAVIGAGFSGLYMLHRLQNLGLRAKIFEAAADIGGTWYRNRYPGARCDNESMDYSYSFDEALQQEWRWTERYASQPEILRYINHVADRFNLRRNIVLNARIASAWFEEISGKWMLTTEGGSVITARFCIMATGCLSMPRQPDIPGIADYRGRAFHTGRWPHEPVDFTDEAVAVIGTGSSAIQLVPVIAEQARRLTVFQRTANFSVPARNVPMTEAYERSCKSDYAARRRQARENTRVGWIYEVNDQSAMAVDDEGRKTQFERRWANGGVNFLNSFNDILVNKDSNDAAAEFIRAKIRTIVQDPRSAAALSPDDHPVGTKRICCDSGYYETFNRPNVTLIDTRRTPIACFNASGICDGDGVIHSFDSVIYATGFDAITGALAAIEICGRAGLSLKEAWSTGPRTYLGLMAVGFPNLFMITGPGSPSVLSNMLVSIEQHVEWISDCISFLGEAGSMTIEPEEEAQSGWVDHVNEVAQKTLFPQANSWYVGANIPGKPRVFMPYVGGVDVYRKLCAEVAAGGYRGFKIEADVMPRFQAPPRKPPANHSSAS
jgi:cyclohexanone monooxygenase